MRKKNTRATLKSLTAKYLAPKFLAAGVLCLYSSFAFSEFQSLDSVVAVVEDGVILKSQLDKRVNDITSEIVRSAQPMPPYKVIQEQILDKLILETIQLQLAKKNGIRVSDNTLSDTMEKIARQNGKNLSEFKQTVEAEGINYRDLRKRIRNDLIVSRLRQKMVANRITITAQDVTNYLNSPEGKNKLSASFRLGHILLSEADEDQANAFYEALMANNNFEEEAQKTGKPYDLGLRKLEQLPTLFVEPAQELEINEIARPIKSGSGYHIIKLLDKQGGDHKVVAQTRARHILIKPNEIRGKEEAKQTIDDIRAQILAGKSFADMARTYSEDPVSANDGGNLGWAQAGDFVPAFDRVMSDLEIGKISEPFYSTFGWHIMEVLERRNENIGKEHQLNQARAILQQKQFEEEIQLWLREIRENAYVEIKIDTKLDDDQRSEKSSVENS